VQLTIAKSVKRVLYQLQDLCPARPHLTVSSRKYRLLSLVPVPDGGDQTKWQDGEGQLCEDHYVAESHGGNLHQILDRRTLLIQGLAVVGAIAFVEASSDAIASGDLIGDEVHAYLNNVEVDLKITSDSLTFGTGTVDGKPATFTGSVFGGFVSGSALGVPVKGTIAKRDQVPDGSNFVTTTKVAGSVGTVSTTLLGTFTIGSNYLFEHGTVTGQSANEPVQVHVVPNHHADTSSAVTVTGKFGGAKVTLDAVIPVGQRGSISGTVDSKKVHFDVTPSKAGDGQPVHLAGHFSGPSNLLALIVGAVSYFGG
jgi:hypothetical protein